MAHAGSRLKPTDCLERHRLESRPSSRTGENPPYGMIGRIEETSASYEARSAPRSYPTVVIGVVSIVRRALAQFEQILCGCKRRHRGEGSDRFAVLDAFVQQLACSGIAGVCDDRPVTEGPRPGLCGSLEDRNDAIPRGDERHQVRNGLQPMSE